MTTAAKQFFRDFASVIYDGASATLRVSLKTLGVVGMSIPALFFIGVIVWAFMTAPSPTPEQKAAEEAARLEEEAARLNRQARDPVAERQKTQLKQELCHEAKACKKYSEARLECATAGNFKTCLRIKMGEDSFYSDMCSGYDVGAPAVPLPPETLTAFECFFLTLWR